MPERDPAKRLTTRNWLTRSQPGEHSRKVPGPQVPLRRSGLSRAPRERKARKDTGASQAVRDAVFARDLGWCVRCGLGVTKGNFSIHHRILRSHGVDNSPQAQILLCGSGTTGCHGHVHANPAEAMAAGWILLGNANTDPAAKPVMVALPVGYMWFLLSPDGKRQPVEAPTRLTDGAA